MRLKRFGILWQRQLPFFILSQQFIYYHIYFIIIIIFGREEKPRHQNKMKESRFKNKWNKWKNTNKTPMKNESKLKRK